MMLHGRDDAMNFKTKPQLVVTEGKPTAVILGIDDYEAMLERLEDAEDLAELRETRKGSMSFRSFDDYLGERVR